jgi:protein SCO1/2
VTSGSVRAPAIGGAFCLVDHNGQPVTERTYFGQFVLVFFGFTHCRVVCPRTLSMLSRTLEAIGTRSSQVQALYVTVDPERDVPQVLRKFLERSYPRFTGLTGELTQVEAMRSLYRVFAERRDESNGDYQMPHSAFTYLVGPSGQYLEHWSPTITEQQAARRLLRRFDDEASSDLQA